MLTVLEAFFACLFSFSLGLVVAQFVQIKICWRRKFHISKEERVE